MAAQSVAEWLGQQLVDEAKLLYGVKAKVKKLQHQLEWMESCDLDSPALENYNSFILKLCAKEVNQLAIESRDLIQKYLDEVASSKQSGCFAHLKRPLHMISSIKPRHKVNFGIDSLTQRMNDLRSNLQTFAFGLTIGNLVYKKKSYIEPEVLSDGVNVIGLERHVGEVVDELLDKGADNTMVVLYGPRGIGKTALAKRVCQGKDIRRSFNGLVSWTHVSRGFMLRDVLERILCDLNSDEDRRHQSTVARTEKQLVYEIRKILQEKRCLVVFDDLSSKELLDYIGQAFSNAGIHSGSKVLLTTNLHQEELSQFSYVKALERPTCLNSEDSWRLLEMTLERSVSADPEMKTIGGEMLNKCKGLPSDIIMLGTILKDKRTPEEWTSAYLGVYNPLRNTLEVLQSSYNKLPKHLRPCLLHLGNFPEEHEISATRLFRMWIAEGFIPSGSEKSMEEIASDYLNELAAQNFVVVTQRGSNLRVKSCLLHDLVRDFCLRKAEQEGFLSIIDRHVDSSSASSSILNRMTILLDVDNFNSFLPTSSVPCEVREHLKSLIIFPIFERIESNCDQQWLEYTCAEWTRLRVLDLEGLRIKGSFPRRVDNMVFLRYLSLKGTKMTNIPSSIGNLRYLQTLDLRVSSTGELVVIPNTLCKITMLMFLCLPAILYEVESTQVLVLDTLSNLETLKNLDATKCHIHDLFGLMKLRRLSLKTCEKNTLKVLLQSDPVTSSSYLQRLSIVVEGVIISQESSILSRCGCLYRLNVEGIISIPLRHDIFPPYLEVLMLESTYLKNDPMPILGYLPNLRRLCLGKDSFLGSMMACSVDGFVQLRVLTLKCLPNIQKWILEVGALPLLKQLLIERCDRLSILPDYFPTFVLVTRKFNGDEIEEYVS
ncbi:hypothetical protein V2J09_001184 [Rumex salicifolius]